MSTGNFGDSMSYRIACDCGQPDHDHNLWIEAEDIGITVTIYATVKSPWWSVNRFKQIWTLLTKGYLEHETVLSMNQQEALNYAETIKSAIEDVNNFRKNKSLR